MTRIELIETDCCARLERSRRKEFSNKLNNNAGRSFPLCASAFAGEREGLGVCFFMW